MIAYKPLVICSVFFAAILSACNQVGDSSIIRISHSHAASDASEIHYFSTQFQVEMSARNSELNIMLYPANAIGQEREVYEGMQLGAGATCAVTGTAILSRFEKTFGLLDLPYLWHDFEHAHDVLDGPIGAALNDKLRRAGLEVIVWLDSWGYRSVVTAKQEISTAQDLKGLKLRTIPTPTYIAAIDAMGAIPTPMAFGEIYSSLETKVIDGFEHSPSVILSNRFFEVADQIVLTKHMYGPVALVCSVEKLEKLNPAERTKLQAAAEAARDLQRAMTREREAEAIADLIAAGMALVEVDTTEFQNVARDARERIAQKLGATALLNAISETRQTTNLTPIQDRSPPHG
ncbi:MAG: DctP family TRAP transporter solute-binding subunit [Henriciella sp.]